MSTDATPATEPQSCPPLTLNERRVLGVLVEKAKTTPDGYPLSLNALVNGCNQKNNRDPVMSLTEVEVQDAVDALKRRQMVQQITGSGRVDKYRHVLYELLRVEKVQLAILAELWLRGPQTEGEIRGRASRMEPIADLDVLRPQLHLLAERGLVVYLTPEGRRGTTLTHGFYPPEELARLRARADAGAVESTVESPGPIRSVEPSLADRVAGLERALAELRIHVEELQRVIASKS
jgi:uncharacterized protein YceH (UPF0502 family)